MSARTLIIGDVHGCVDELRALIERAQLGPEDRLISVGDLLARGPASREVIKLMRTRRALAVRGNHEERLLRWHRGERKSELGTEHRALAETLRKADWQWLHALPLWLDLPEHGARVLHGGVRPDVPWSAQSREDLLHLRDVHDERGEKIKWGARYRDEPHVVFGHDARAGLQLYEHCTGLDTGCVYGGQLTGLLLAPGQRIPQAIEQRRACLLQIPAQRRYFDPFA